MQPKLSAFFLFLTPFTVPILSLVTLLVLSVHQLPCGGIEVMRFSSVCYRVYCFRRALQYHLTMTSIVPGSTRAMPSGPMACTLLI